MQTKQCTICNTALEVEARCKVCKNPTRLFCHACDVVREKESHPECMMKDYATLVAEVHMY